MKTISYYKDEALKALSGRWVASALVTYIFLAILAGIPIVFILALGSDGGDTESSEYIGNIISILLLPLYYGYAILFLNISRREDSSIKHLFDGFKDYKRILGTIFLLLIYITLWGLLFFIPGIVKSYSYSMTPYILKDNPSLKYNSAIEESMRLMQGHKMQLFLLDLSMIGWAILSFLTLGIGFLLLGPYNQTAHAAFYQDLIAEDNPDAFDEDGKDYEEPIDGPDFEEVK